MAGDLKIRWGWLRFMYFYTIAGAGALGLGILIAPGLIKSIFSWPLEEPITVGIVGSVYVAFAVLSIFGLRSPLKFAPVLLLQLCYKSIWFIVILLPAWVAGQFPGYGTLIAIIFATYIVGDLVAIPFSTVFAKPSESTS
jgi:hypothetical protein